MKTQILLWLLAVAVLGAAELLWRWRRNAKPVRTVSATLIELRILLHSGRNAPRDGVLVGCAIFRLDNGKTLRFMLDWSDYLCLEASTGRKPQPGFQALDRTVKETVWQKGLLTFQGVQFLGFVKE
ncbi:MAG: hypothetical protein IJ438_07470 [Clostridia bacterium]|nr:hypothetical protein [Clostridia bacterium]